MAPRVTQRDIAALSTYVDCGTVRATANRRGLTPGTVKNSLSILQDELGAPNTTTVVHMLHDAIAEYRAAPATGRSRCPA